MRILVLEPCGLHVGFLGCYGNDWIATPNLDRLAAEGVVFDQHLVDRPELSLDTPLSQRSAGSGRYAWPGTELASSCEHTLPGPIGCRRLTCPTWHDFSAAGGAIRQWQDSDAPVFWLEGPSLLPPWSLPEDMLGVYCEGEGDDDDEDIAPWPDPPLGPAVLSADDLVRLQDTYAAVVTYWDALLGNLLDELRREGRLDELTLCVTSRAGLSLGEHGAIGLAGPQLHDELIHVPLLLRLPQTTKAGLRISALTQPVDLLPTFGDLLGVPVGDVHGFSLRPLILGSAQQLRPYACAALRLGEEEQWLLRTPEWALHLPIAPAGAAARLFVKPDDRWEVNDVSTRQPEAVDRLESTLRHFAKDVCQPGRFIYPPVHVD